ncbi:aminomethyltransferase [Streptoalloteichus tenebrarius]|uniref:Aminomethyltransferase n=1 Tax=Streptoalloteichus tenebrarius (strain ATCC 17920 / DSM 40477 / JCM 4838 / CBS 697.72 / NBRC 16177 / NCIMB 11028 / NRRL B-12390 / A12253. 1 / ISP 5477) TaxID=1933 RepID=A0ABT1HX28_STRSD|nr:glycine cleavage system aminomethyltransferase GcvT [Streptoalloteichus tenebrarius]MCP2260070.1 aminomethyltransferase [Streptoalloteichus tenebrarius]
MSETALRHSPLHAAHAALGATFAPFGGWEMPIQYADGGVVAEHTAVREAVGVFDVSHLGKALVSGRGAAEFVNACLTNDLRRITPGQAQYTLCCTESGGVVDDLIAYLVGEDEVFLVPNAANTAEVCRRLAAAAPPGVAVTDLHTDHGVLAVQGPRSAEVLTALGLPADLDYMAFTDAEWSGRPVRVCRTGYTGEHGYELLPRWDDTPALWTALLAAAEDRGGRACGLGARDTLRTEMGYPLHGQDLSPEISPVQAGAGWAVGWKKPAFWGRDALVAERAEGPARRLRGLRALERGVPRPGMPVLDAGGRRIGVTTSGTFSPTLRTGVALALVDTSAGVEPGAEALLDVRGRRLRCEVVKPPFVQAHVR